MVSWLSNVFIKGPTDSISLCCMILWCLWRNRNEILWNNKRQRIPSLLNLASSFLFQWQSAQVTSIGDDLPSADNSLVCWKRPRFGWVKCNVDGTVFSHLNRLGFGWVISDADGQMLAASNDLLAGPFDVGLAEAFSFREALSWLKAHSFSKVIMGTDALKVFRLSSLKRLIIIILVLLLMNVRCYSKKFLIVPSVLSEGQRTK
ncbi:hypothetical protein Ddye_019783 [Dipteronia dyeriana]|uniref:RNase H type-1 domain-containing protein n=1 Tax=Dipteronia dyeriana TaxID=168575 RepID=A0AAD9TZF3_9ROSI|nr:hypothetical protein Ddye_019783 [Dipteronia dyeriana]